MSVAYTSLTETEQVARARVPPYRKQGQGAAFVYICGLEGTGELFYKQAEDLSRDHTVINFPLRATGSYRLDFLIEDFCDVMHDARVTQATVLGESFGGMLAMAAALAAPHLFERLILLNTFPFFEDRSRIRLGATLFKWLPYHAMKSYRTFTSKRQLFSDDIEDVDRHLFREKTRNVKRDGYVSRLQIIRDTDLRSRLEEIKIPTLVVASRADRLVDSLRAAETMVEKIPHARLKILETTGHTALLSKHVRVRDWLGELESIN